MSTLKHLLKQIKTNLDCENRLNQDPLVHSPSLTGKFHIRFTSKSISQVGAAKTDYVRDQPPVALIVAGKVSELNFFDYYIKTSEIPSELSRENFISSHVKITCYLHT